MSAVERSVLPASGRVLPTVNAYGLNITHLQQSWCECEEMFDKAYIVPYGETYHLQARLALDGKPSQ